MYYALQSGMDAPAGDGKPSEHTAALAVASQIALLVLTLMLGHAATRRGWTCIGEAGIALLLGMGVGLAVMAVHDMQGSFAQAIGFHKQFFFLAILPPIMFEAGFRLDVDRFFANLDGIAAFAFIGTVVSTAAMGALVWAAGAAGLCLPLLPLHALIFGSIVSATDPVTVLSVFQRLGADRDLYALVFGESVLNDAVAMVLYRSLSRFLTIPVTPAAICAAVAAFVGVFAGSVLLGCAVALATAALVKSRYFRSSHAPLESSLVVLLAYASYVLADALGVSGIVSVLSCGVFMAKYVRPNLTPTSRDRVGALFKLLSTLAEVFVFLFIGASICLDSDDFQGQGLPSFLAVCFAALALSRAVNIWPCAALVNCLRPREQAIPQSHQFVMWWSGLRGAMAFAIAIEAADTVPGAGKVILPSTYFIILATVVVNGGSAAWMLERLGLKADTGATSRRISVGDGLDLDSSAEDDLVERLMTASSAGMALDDTEAADPGRSQDWKKNQLRHAIRDSGLLRQLTLENTFLEGMFLEPRGSAAAASSIAPSIAGDVPPTPRLFRPSVR